MKWLQSFRSSATKVLAVALAAGGIAYAMGGVSKYRLGRVSMLARGEPAAARVMLEAERFAHERSLAWAVLTTGFAFCVLYRPGTQRS